MRTVIIINGVGTCGKDKFVELCSKYLHNSLKIFNVSTVDKVKEAAKIIGWSEVKDEESRLALSELKSLSRKYFNHPIQYILNEKSKLDEWYSFYLMFVHSREPQEIDYFKKNIENCYTLLIKNPNSKDIKSNPSDKNVENYNYDYIIYNNGTLCDFQKKAIDFIDKLKEERKI